MSKNSFNDFFKKCKEENRIPDSSEIFDELKNCGVFEGTELRRRDAANLMAASTLAEACMGLLINEKSKESMPEKDGRCYAMIPEITGGLGWFPYIISLGDLMSRAFVKYVPGQNPIRCAEGVTLNKGDSELDVIFKNIEVYLDKNSDCSYDSKACKAYRSYKKFEIIPDIQNMIASYTGMFLETPWDELK